MLARKIKSVDTERLRSMASNQNDERINKQKLQYTIYDNNQNKINRNFKKAGCSKREILSFLKNLTGQSIRKKKTFPIYSEHGFS